MYRAPQSAQLGMIVSGQNHAQPREQRMRDQASDRYQELNRSRCLPPGRPMLSLSQLGTPLQAKFFDDEQREFFEQVSRIDHSPPRALRRA